MWKTTLFLNILLLALFWLLSLTAISPAYNLMVQYVESKIALPIFTDFAFQVRPFAWIIPFLWAVVTLFFSKWISKQPEDKRNNYPAAHTSVTLCMGIAMLIFFLLAGILPILKIGTIFN
jgi:hypothetical protein